MAHRQLFRVVVVLVLILGLELGSGLVWVRWTDQRHHVSEHRLDAAMLIFRHSPDKGVATKLSVDDLVSHHTIIAQPPRCAPLASAATSLSAFDGAVVWSGTVGDPAQWVVIVTVRFSSARAARRTLLSKRMALVRCHRSQVTFPPFVQLSDRYLVSGHSPICGLSCDRVRYKFSGPDSQEFYMRQFANTVTWSYGSADKSSQVRAEVVDSLVACLQELERP